MIRYSTKNADMSMFDSVTKVLHGRLCNTYFINKSHMHNHWSFNTLHLLQNLVFICVTLGKVLKV